MYRHKIKSSNTYQIQNKRIQRLIRHILKFRNILKIDTKSNVQENIRDILKLD